MTATILTLKIIGSTTTIIAFAMLFGNMRALARYRRWSTSGGKPKRGACLVTATIIATAYALTFCAIWVR